MKQKQRITALLMVICLLLTMLPIGSLPVLAVDGTLAGDGSKESPYQIIDAADLKAFADKVNNDGETGAWAELRADIDLNPGMTFNEDGIQTGDTPEEWTPIGSVGQPYTGTFDGNGKTISGVYINNTSDYQGLFGYIKTGTVQNLGVVNSYIRAKDYVGGIAGRVKDSSDDRAKITNCFSNATVIGTDSLAWTGGITSSANYADIENCYNTGAVSGGSNTGGVVGYVDFSSSITNSYNTGTVTGSDSGYTGGVAGYISFDSSVTNCYNTGAVSGTYITGGVAGYVSFDSSVTNCYNTGAISGTYITGGVTGEGDSDSTFENCYFLETSAAAGIGSGGGGANIGKLSAVQMTGTAAKTNMNVFDFTNTWKAGNDTTVWEYLGENEKGEGVYGLMAQLPQLKVFTDAGKGHEELALETTTDLPKETGSDGKTYYLIYNAHQLATFRDIVNGNLTDEQKLIYTEGVSANGRLMTDIDLNPGYTFHTDGSNTYSGEGDAPGVQDWTPIGNNTTRYTGTFDGNGHTVSGVYINNTSTTYQGLFGRIGSGGTVKNLGVVNSYIRASDHVGGIAGDVYGSSSNHAKVTNCFNEATVIGTTAVTYTGGIVGYASYMDIENCYNTGTVSGGFYVGGVVGDVFDGSTITNSYNTGTVSDGDYTGGVAGCVWLWGNNTVKNCYYLGTSAPTGIDSGKPAGVTKLTAQDMTGSGAASKLSGFDFDSTWTAGDDTTSWKYTGTNEKGEGVYGLMAQLPQLKVFTDAGKGHEAIPLETQTGLQQETINGENYYLIYNADQLKTFRNIVNGNLTDEQKLIYTEGVSANGKLMADIVLNENFDQDKFAVNDSGNVTYDGGEVPDTFEQWTPIGNYDRKYTGTFDGNGKTVSGVYINNDSAEYQGLFGYVGSGTVKTLGVVNSYIRAGSYVGGIVGYVEGSSSNRAKITNCFSEATVIVGASFWACAGGITSSAEYSDIENCHNTGSVSGGEYADVGGVAGNASSNSTVTNCYNTGTVSGGSDIGGVVGDVDESTITNCHNTGTVSGGSNTGGVAGELDGSTITNCHNTGTVSGGSNTGSVAGELNGSTITNCYNTGTVNDGYSIGGVAGDVWESTIENCYNTGTVSGGSNTGGVAGDVNEESTITNCYYLEGTADTGIGFGSGQATSLSIAQIEDTSENGLLALLGNGVPEGEEDPWNTTLSAVGTWEYGKPAVQPVFIWQTPIQNTPTYSVTIPEKATAGGQAAGVALTSAGALRADQQVTVSVAEDTNFNLYYGGNTSDDSIAYQAFAGGNQTALKGGDAILTSGNTATGQTSQVSLTFHVTGTPKYSGSYTGTITFTVSVKDAA